MIVNSRLFQKGSKEILDGLHKQFEDGKVMEIFAVTFDASGTLTCYAAGNKYHYAIAAGALQGHFTRMVIDR